MIDPEDILMDGVSFRTNNDSQLTVDFSPALKLPYSSNKQLLLAFKPNFDDNDTKLLKMDLKPNHLSASAQIITRFIKPRN